MTIKYWFLEFLISWLLNVMVFFQCTSQVRSFAVFRL